MRIQVNVQEAKTRLSDLIARAERGEEVVIARAGTPVVRLAPVGDMPPRVLGRMPFHVPDTFFDPLPDVELDAWEHVSGVDAAPAHPVAG